MPGVAKADDEYPELWGFQRPAAEGPTIGDRPVSGLTSGTGAYYATGNDRWTDGEQPEPQYPTSWRSPQQSTGNGTKW